MKGDSDPLTGSDTGTWTLLDDEASEGALNMARDQWLMESVRRGGAPTLRLYGWSPACLSLGRNQPSDGIQRLETQIPDIQVVRRMTGGRAVLHDREITYSVVVAARQLGSPRAAYTQINRILVAALNRCGVAAALADAGSQSPPIPSTAPCFAEPVTGEIMLRGGKLVGSAQVHRDGVLLQHGSILLQPSPHLAEVEAVLGRPVEGHCSYLQPTPDFRQRFVDALGQEWQSAVGPLSAAEPISVDQGELSRLAERFRDPRWTWRR